MGKSVDHYLSMGCDQKTAEYLAAGRRRITGVTANNNYTLTIKFDNGEKRLYNAAPLLQPGTVFAPLRELANFHRVYLDERDCIAWDIDPSIDSKTVWSNKIDLCPDTCYIDSIPIE